MGKVQLYTCDSGVSLFKSGNKFGAWIENSPSYSETDFKILVDEEHIVPSKLNGEYDVFNVESVKIIG